MIKKKKEKAKKEQVCSVYIYKITYNKKVKWVINPTKKILHKNMKSIMKALQNPNAKIAMKLKRLNEFTEHPEPGKGKGVGMQATKMGCYFFVVPTKDGGKEGGFEGS